MMPKFPKYYQFSGGISKIGNLYNQIVAAAVAKLEIEKGVCETAIVQASQHWMPEMTIYYYEMCVFVR